MKTELIFILSLLSSGLRNPSGQNLTFLPQLQQLCPCSSFCEVNVMFTFLENDTSRPCCSACSCKPGCEVYDNCCFDHGVTDVLRKCPSPELSQTKVPATKYVMIHSCSRNQDEIDLNKTYNANVSDINSFAPVTSIQDGDVFANTDCAVCNGVYEYIHWKIAFECPMGNEDHSLYIRKLLLGEDVGTTECHLSFVPPQHTGLGLGDGKYPGRQPFISMLDGTINLVDLDRVPPTNNKDGCGPTEVLVQSLKTECRPVLCPWGQFRLGGECGFYSNEWIGGPFTAVLKLTPIVGTQRMDRSVIADMESGLKYNTKAKWLKRDAMKHWNVATLYRPSYGRQYVEYLVVIAAYPGPVVNPVSLRTILNRTLEETWQLVAGNHSFSLQVQFDRYGHYKKQPKQALMTEGLCIDEDYVYINTLMSGDSLYQYLLEVYFPRMVVIHPAGSQMNLNELFLCDLIELRQDEFELLSGNLLFKVTNETLYVSEYRLTLSGYYSICLNRFNKNRFNRSRCFFCAPLDNYIKVILGGLVLVYVSMHC